MTKEATAVEPIYAGSRVSKRQRDKRERLLKLQKEKEAAEALAGEWAHSHCELFVSYSTDNAYFSLAI